MEKKEAVNEILNDLLKINNDRIAGYERAISETKGLDIDLKAIFQGMVEESKVYKDQLAKEIIENCGVVEDEVTAAGKVYRAWMDIKATMTDSDRSTILDSCEFGEDAAQRAYEAAIASDITDINSLQLIKEQQAALKRSHDMIKRQRDAQKAIKG